MGSLLPVLHGAGWMYATQDVQRLHDLAAGGFMVAKEQERIVGCAVGLPQGPVGWIGSVLVEAPQRGAGTGRRLVEACIGHLKDAGCRTIKLYSAPKAITLYQRLGFNGESECLMMTGTARPRRDEGGLVPPDEAGWDGVLALDRAATGADRGALLRRLADDFPALGVVALSRDGAVAAAGFAREGKDAGEIGPVVARPGAGHDAGRVIDALLSRLPHGRVEVASPRQGPGAEAFRCRGFEVNAVGLEMRSGPPEGRDLGMIAAAAGQEKG